MSAPSSQYGVFMQRPHVVLLGAGASVAATPNGDRDGLTLPLMKEIPECTGLIPLLDSAGIFDHRDDFEKLYSQLITSNSYSQILSEVEKRVTDYFAGLNLPEEPTIYDYLVLSLRGKDLIATFNWDPLLWQALNRCNEYLKGEIHLPSVRFLHGNTAIGYVETGDRVVFGTLGSCSRANGQVFTGGPLLFPIENKDYSSDKRISSSWKDMAASLQGAYIFTIFGYARPESDVEAVALLGEGWGDRNDRRLEEIEIIDILPEKELRSRWSSFICGQHYRTTDSFFDSIVCKCPRRSCEGLWSELMDRVPIQTNPLPAGSSWEELLSRVRQLAEEEEIS